MLFRQLIFVVISLVSCSAIANFISQSDIDSIDITAPEGWQTLNTHQLIDGVTDRYTSTRFAAYQNQGDYLSSTNPYKISVNLLQSKNITSLGLFNDWNNFLNQQVSSMSINLYNEFDNLVWSDDFSNVRQNTWSEIELVDFSSAINSIQKIDFNITGSIGNHFEIRELLIGFSNSPATPSSSAVINAPSMFALLLLAVASIMVFRFK